ncbi:MAG TPA: hypothetical protein VH482_32650 [Thermomicrobiales bacterium]|jgi:hypothetical protein
MGTQIQGTPPGFPEPEHHEDRQRRLDRIGHAALLAGVVLVYLILFAAPWSDRARAQVALLILTLVACVVAMARKTPDQD